MKRAPSAAMLLVALLLSALQTACMAPAQFNADGPAYEVSVAYIGSRPAVAWYGGRLQRAALFMRYVSNTGSPRGPVLQLTDGVRDAYEPSLQDIGGDAVVAWYEQEAAPREGGARRQIALLARFDAQGRPRWQQQLSAADASGRNPVIRVRGDTVHAAWIEQRAGAVPMIRVASLDAAGRWLQTPRDAMPVGSDTWNLNAAVGDDGVFHVLYDSGYGSVAKELHWMRVLADRVDDQRISADDGSESAYPDIALDGTHAAVTWFDQRDGNAEIYLRCLQLEGSGLPRADLRVDDDAARRVTHTPGDSLGAYATWYGGGIALAWIEVAGERRRLLLQRFDSGCQALGNAAEWSGKQGAAGIPSLAATRTGLALAWDEQRRGSDTRNTSAVLMHTWPQGATRIAP